MSGWYYQIETEQGNNHGPLTEREILLAAYDGRVKPGTKVRHEVNTNDRWIRAASLSITGGGAWVEPNCGSPSHPLECGVSIIRSLANTMKSFRLDTNSINDAIESWPAILAAIVLCGLMAYLGWFDAIWRVTMIAFGGIYFGYAFRGSLTKTLRSKYPNAAYIGLLSIGFSAATFGVLARMMFPLLQNGFLDCIWLSISFTTIFAFVVINRRDPDVLK